jgi:hypothetical protein
MAAATTTALIAAQPGASVATAFPQVTPNGVASQNLDLIQIVSDGLIVLNVDSAGAVHNPAVNATTFDGGAGATRIAQYETHLSSGDTTAHYFADAFANPSSLDILQVINLGGNASYWLDFLGVAHGS